MFSSTAIKLPFHVADPLGIPRPVSRLDFFGSARARLFRNQFPVPSGCLRGIDLEVYRPYLAAVAAKLRKIDPLWNDPTIADDPPRYCFLKEGFPAEVPEQLWSDLPAPPRVSLEMVLQYLDSNHPWAPPIQLLDLLSIINEDVGTKVFRKITENHPWVSRVML